MAHLDIYRETGQVFGILNGSHVPIPSMNESAVKDERGGYDKRTDIQCASSMTSLLSSPRSYSFLTVLLNSAEHNVSGVTTLRLKTCPSN